MRYCSWESPDVVERSGSYSRKWWADECQVSLTAAGETCKPRPLTHTLSRWQVREKDGWNWFGKTRRKQKHDKKMDMAHNVMLWVFKRTGLCWAERLVLEMCWLVAEVESVKRNCWVKNRRCSSKNYSTHNAMQLTSWLLSKAYFLAYRLLQNRKKIRHWH